MAHNRPKEARENLQKVADFNRKQMPEGDLEQTDANLTQRQGDVRDLFSSMAMTKRTLILWFAWWVCRTSNVGTLLLTEISSSRLPKTIAINILSHVDAQSAPAKTDSHYFHRMVIALVYYAVSFSAGDYGGNRYLVFFLTSLIEIPSNWTCIKLNHR